MADVIQEYTVEGGTTLRAAIRCASQGEIKRCALFQSDGSPDGFSYAFYTREIACPPGIVKTADEEAELKKAPEARDSTVAALYRDRELYRVGHAQVVPAGKPHRMSDDDQHATAFEDGDYRNRDAGQTNRKRQLYLELKVPGTGPKHFHLALTIKPLTVG